MILDDVQLIEILMKRPNKALIAHGEEQRKRARLHLYGVGMEDFVVQIQGFEKPFMRELRLQYGLSNVDMFARLRKPIAKVYTARGGNSYYNLGEPNNAYAAMMESNVKSGLSCKKWIEQIWQIHSEDDPMGLVFVEVDKNWKAYPTYKCITTIHDYLPNGRNLEYVIFKISKEDKAAMKLEKDVECYRVVDDVEDRIVIFNSQRKTVETVMEHSYLNRFGYVPAIINGYIPNPDGVGYVSIYNNVFSLAENFLVQQGIKMTAMFRHGFPKYYEFGDDCMKCNASGKVNGRKCPDCKGTKKKLMLFPSDIKIMDYPTKDAPGVDIPGGYIEPSKAFHDIVTIEVNSLEEKVYRTVWGSRIQTKLNPGMGISGAPNGTQTATEVIDNKQPEIDCLHAISDAAEATDKFIMDSKITVELGQPKYREKGGCSRNYGRRFLIEEPDVLIQRFIEARDKGLSPAILFGMYELYLEAKYQTDGVSLSLHKKLMKIEPYFCYTLSEMKNMGFTPEQIRMKANYGEWLVQADNDWLIAATRKQCKDSFNDFLSKQPLPVEEKDPETKKKEKA